MGGVVILPQCMFCMNSVCIIVFPVGITSKCNVVRGVTLQDEAKSQMDSLTK